MTICRYVCENCAMLNDATKVCNAMAFIGRTYLKLD